MLGARGRLAAMALFGALVLVAGCGGDDDDDAAAASTSGDDYVAAISEAFGDDPEMSDEAMTCVAEAYVEVIGVERFEEAGISPQDIRDNPDKTPEEMGLELTEADTTQLAEIALRCPGMSPG